MPGWVIPIIVILIAIVSRVMKAVRQSQEKAQRGSRPAGATRTKSLSERLGFDTGFDTPSATQPKSATQPTDFRIDSKSPWESGQAKRMPAPDGSPMDQTTAREKMKVENPTERLRKADDEYRALVDESAGSDEEAFEEETAALYERSDGSPLPSERRSGEPTVPAKHEPIRIAGIPLTPQTIRQGIVITEILRRPEF